MSSEAWRILAVIGLITGVFSVVAGWRNDWATSTLVMFAMVAILSAICIATGAILDAIRAAR